MISSETRRPSAFEPMVLISRFISCSRKSSLRPHGSSLSASASQCARCARNRVTSSLMSDRAAARTISCAIIAWSTGSSSADLARSARAAAPRPPRAPRRPPPRSRSISSREQLPARRRGRRAGGRLRAPASRRDRRAPARPPPRRSTPSCASSAGIGLDRPLADGDRLRQPQQIARRQRARRPGRARAPLERRGQRVGEVLVQLDRRRRRRAQLHRDRQLHAAARQPLLQQRADARLEVGQRLRHAQLHVEEPVVDRPHGDADRRPLVLVRQRGEAGHRLDHGRSPTVGSSSASSHARALPAAAARRVSHTRRRAPAARRACPTRRSRPRSSTTIASARRTVDSRWAMTNDVRFSIRFDSASCTSISDSASSDDVASSRIRIGESRRMRPGNRQPLPLAARQPLAALADHRVVAVGRAPTMNSCACAARAAASISARRRGRPAVGDVGGDRVVEQHRLLRDDADLRRAARPASRRGCRGRRSGSRRRSRRRTAESG